jgi:cytoskeletal protein CcmA (bactofilin family)
MSDHNGSANGKHTLVEEGTELTGTIKSSVPIVVMGKVDGDITGPEIQISAKGVVAGNIKVQKLRSEGELAGSVEADAVQIAGRVRDRTVIKARSLEVTLASKGMEVTFGECELAVGDEPNKDAAVAAATAAAEPPKKAEKGDKGDPRRPTRPSEMAWDKAAVDATSDATPAATPPAATPPADDEPKRKRGTQPPPVG